MTGPDPKPSLQSTPVVGRVGQEAVIRSDVWSFGWAVSRQLVQQCLGLFQIGGIEALGEPPVDRGE
jgi:hypothetical protein